MSADSVCAQCEKEFQSLKNHCNAMTTFCGDMDYRMKQRLMRGTPPTPEQVKKIQELMGCLDKRKKDAGTSSPVPRKTSLLTAVLRIAHAPLAHIARALLSSLLCRCKEGYGGRAT